MGLPRHLREKFSATNGAPIATAAAAGQETTSATTTTATGSADDPTLTREVAAHDEATQRTDANGEAAATAASAVADAAASATPEAESAAATTSSTPDANYKRMEGRYKADLQRLKDQLEEAKEAARGAAQLTDLLMQTRQELADLRGGGAAAATTAKDGKEQVATERPTLPELTEEELAMYGEFTPGSEKLIARATVPLLAEIADLKKQGASIGEKVGRSEERQFVDRVASQVPDMGAISQQPEWLEYLKQPIPLTSLSIKDALLDAHNARDLNRVVGIFNEFKKAHSTEQSRAGADAASAATASATSAADGNGKTQTNGLAQFATPDRTAADGNGKPKPKFRNSDYRKKAIDMRAGRMSKEAFMQFEKEFFDAQRAGLVQNE